MTSQACARAIYWRAKPGQLDAYSAYLNQHVEPVDEEACRPSSTLPPRFSLISKGGLHMNQSLSRGFLDFFVV